VARIRIVFFFALPLLLFAITACLCIPYAPRTPPPGAATKPPLPAAKPTPTATPDPTREAQAACPALLAEMLEVSEGGSAPEMSPRRRLPVIQNEATLVTYQVTGDQLSDPQLERVPQSLRAYQQDTAAQQAIWDYFAAIIPAGERDFVNRYLVITDGQEEILAAVVQDEYDPSLWALAVDILDAGDRKALGATLLHEFAHLLTLNTRQVETDTELFNNPDDPQAYEQGAATCPQYFADEGCSLPDSYLNRFYQRFWGDIAAEWEEINAIVDDEERDDRLYEFYRAHRDQFVTDYAVTSPEEDIAESWMFYMLAPQPAGASLAEQKILFFYEWPELVALRDEITGRVCNYFGQP
jgi:hypothetical protein